MKRQSAITMAAAALLAGCATSRVATIPTVPENLKAPADQVLSLEVQAVGVQIYQCSPSKADPARFEWAFRAPEADLFDSTGTKVGKHYAGPTWELNDQSKVVGQVSAQDPGPDANAIPWLLLKAKSASGQGSFAQTQSVQRVQTVGGKAPAAGCSQAEAGTMARVPYKAAYYFYAARP